MQLLAWAGQLGPPSVESRRSKLLARTGGLAAVTSLIAYLTWRVTFTLPAGGWNLPVAWLLITFEALPLAGMALKVVTLWNIDSVGPKPVTTNPRGMRVAVLIPTYNEPVEVIAPTIAAACDLRPQHETWVLDDGDRPWLPELCDSMGARYVSRPTHDHAKAGNLNHALAMMAAEEAAGTGGVDVVAVLDCDHVPLSSFLTATLGWFDDPKVALVQGPQAFYNAGAFDDDGIAGEQGLFFNVLMRARHHAGAGPFWCGSTSLLRVSALRDVGGVATETITEDMHTTLKLIRRDWTTVYHHQTLAVGIAPATPEQYLLQRRRWGMGAMQILTLERLWSAKSWMSWRNFHEYLNGTLWWLEGIATLVAFVVPAVILLSGAQTSTAAPGVFAAVFGTMFTVRLWGAKRLLRGQIHWPTAFALRILRVPVGVACAWWLVIHRTLQFEVTDKGGSAERVRGRIPRILVALTCCMAVTLGYSAAGLAGLVPWRTNASSTVASGLWLLLAGAVLFLGTRRIRRAEFATSRRNAHRLNVRAAVTVDGVEGHLVDISVGGACVQFPSGTMPELGLVEFHLPGAQAIKMSMSRPPQRSSNVELASLQAVSRDWIALQIMSLWLFHTPDNVIAGLPPSTPAMAIRDDALAS